MDDNSDTHAFRFRFSSDATYDQSSDWLYAWGDLPTNLDDLRAYLKAHDIDIALFKESARYEANLERFPWLKDL